MSDAHAHDNHPPHLAHHFETPEQQMESGKLGMWVFLATEILMFGGLFCAYSVYRANHPDVFLFAHQFLDTKWGAINTAILLASSFTMAWGVRAAQLGQKSLLVLLLCLTLCGGAGFMVIKTIEYSGKYSHGLWVGPVNAFYRSSGALTNVDNFDKAEHYLQQKTAGGHGEEHASHDEHGADAEHGDNHAVAEGGDEHAESGDDHAAVTVEVSSVARPVAGPSGINADLIEHPHPHLEGAESFITGVGAIQAAHHGSHYPAYQELDPRDKLTTSTFFQIYYVMTGLHGIHVLIGMGLITWILVKSIKGTFSPAYYTPVDLVGLYWHLVDLIWIFLFPLLYLIH